MGGLPQGLDRFLSLLAPKEEEEIQLQAQIPLRFGLKSSKTNPGLQAALTRNL